MNYCRYFIWYLFNYHKIVGYNKCICVYSFLIEDIEIWIINSENLSQKTWTIERHLIFFTPKHWTISIIWKLSKLVLFKKKKSILYWTPIILFLTCSKVYLFWCTVLWIITHIYICVTLATIRIQKRSVTSRTPMCYHFVVILSPKP